MIIKWLGHASFGISLDNGTTIITDPYKTGFHESFKYDPLNETADIATVSHEHGDHNAVEELNGNPETVRGAGVHQVKGIEFTGMAAYHDNSRGAERGPNTIFCFSVEGVKLCHMGDLGHMLDSNQLEALADVNILFIPTGGPMATLPLEDVNNICQQVNPNIIIPMHYRNDKCTFPPHTVEDFIAGKTNAVRYDKSEFVMTAEKLPDSPQIIVLESVY